MRFFVGLDSPHHAQHFERCMLSVNRLAGRKSDIHVASWMMDSGAFTKVEKFGGYPNTPSEYAEQVVRWSRCGTLVAAVAEDFMCEPFMLKRTLLGEQQSGGRYPAGGVGPDAVPLSREALEAMPDLSEQQGLERVRQHQRWTVERYDALLEAVGDEWARSGRAGDAPYILPVLQGYAASEYVEHIRLYGPRLGPGQWVGVGSVCKRNSHPGSIETVLLAIHTERPDLKLHGFGVKLTALQSDVVRSHLHTADSMAWSFAARRQGRNQHDWREAARYADRIAEHYPSAQTNLFTRMEHQ